MTEIAAGYFPDYDVQQDIQIRRRRKTKITESKTGIEQRRRMFPLSGATGTGHKGGYGYITCTSDAYTPQEREAVAAFLDSVEGAFKAFYIFRKDRDNFTNYEVGSVTAATSIIIPFKDFVPTHMTIDDSPVGGYSITPNIGIGGEDRLNFPLSTGVIRITGRGRERWLVRCESDEEVQSFLAGVKLNDAVYSLAFKQVR